MTKYEQLMENYEDALFALLMERAIEEQGARFLEENERLKNDTGFSIATGLNRKINRLINRTFCEGNADKMWRFTGRLIRRVAVIVLVATLLFTTAFAVSEPVRAATLNFVSATFYDHMEIRFVEKDSVLPIESNSLDFEVGWLPDGFVISDSRGAWPDVWKVYKDLNGCVLGIEMVSLSNLGVLGVDTERAKIKEVRINGIEAKIIINENIHVLLTNEERGIIFNIFSEGDHVSEEEMIKVAESIAY